MTLTEKESCVVDEASAAEMPITRHVQMGRFDDVIEHFIAKRPYSDIYVPNEDMIVLISPGVDKCITPRDD